MPKAFADHKGLCGDAGISTPESAALACAFRSRATMRRRRESVPLFTPVAGLMTFIFAGK
jgi:hypothetical protein